jgi:hypothetical protein
VRADNSRVPVQIEAHHATELQSDNLDSPQGQSMGGLAVNSKGNQPCSTSDHEERRNDADNEANEFDMGLERYFGPQEGRSLIEAMLSFNSSTQEPVEPRSLYTTHE